MRKSIKDQLARALADYDNLRKRSEEEKQLWVKFSSLQMVEKLLPVLDILESARKHMNNSGLPLNDQGLSIAVGEFKKVLSEEGLEEIKPEADEAFDPQLHDAVELVAGDKEGQIAQLILCGWKFKDEVGLPAERRIIRHAKVKVYSGTKSEARNPKSETNFNV